MTYVDCWSKEVRDLGMEKLTSDPRMQFRDRPPVFDGERLIAGGISPDRLHGA